MPSQNPRMTRDEAWAWAERWAGDWNRLDVEAVVAHLDDDVVWSSPKALQAMGQGTLHGKAAVREYLTGVPRRVRALRFTVRRILWDPESTELSIVYDRDVDGVHDRASEILHFAPSGRVDRGEVHYGVIP